MRVKWLPSILGLIHGASKAYKNAKPIIMLTRITIPAKVPLYMYNMYNWYCLVVLGRNVVRNIYIKLKQLYEIVPCLWFWCNFIVRQFAKMYPDFACQLFILKHCHLHKNSLCKNCESCALTLWWSRHVLDLCVHPGYSEHATLFWHFLALVQRECYFRSFSFTNRTIFLFWSFTVWWTCVCWLETGERRWLWQITT